MELLSSLPKVLVDLAVGLLKLRGDDRTRQRLADLLCNVADCVAGIGSNIEAGVHDATRCAELSTYIAHLGKLVAEETDQRTADQLTFWLKHVQAVPGYAKIDVEARILSEVKPKWSASKRFQQAQEVKEIAGIIRGVGNLVCV